MAVSTNDLRNGMTLDLPEGLFAVVEFQHVKPGKGGAFVRTKLKNQRTGAVIERTYRADEKLEQAIIDKREMQFLYRDGSDYVFMDSAVVRAAPGRTPASLGDAAQLPEGGRRRRAAVLRREIVGVDLPAAVELTVTDTEPGLQGDRVSGARKPATLETGLVLQVPLFVNPRREDQGRHPHRRVPDPGLTAGPIGPRRSRRRDPAPGPDRSTATMDPAPATRPASGRSPCSTRRS